jgi:ATP adenylyltransferase
METIMDVLWAPWRMEYILSDQKGGDCIFCTGEDRSGDEERMILHVGERTMVMMNRYPYNNGHLLVAPVRHVPGMDHLSQEEMLDLILMVRSSMGILTKLMNPSGFNVGLNIGPAAGAGVADHMHFHIVPRWDGDTNFMAAVGEVKVIPEHIRETYRKLLLLFQKLQPGSGGDV